MAKSLIEYAYEFVSKSKDPVNFADIWAYVKAESGLSEKDANAKAGQFFTNILLDGRFVTLGENEWDLRERHTFDKVHIDMKDVYKDVQTSDDDTEGLDQEDLEYEEDKSSEDSDKEELEDEESEEESEEREF